MSSTIAALPPPTHRISHKPEYDGAPDVPEIGFNELWQDKKDGITFGDVLDIVNPLQHIPVVSTIYRMATDDNIGIGSRLLGGALFGGPLGVLITGLTAIFEEVSGRSIDEHVAALWNTPADEGKATSQIAATEKTGPIPAALPLIEDDYAAATMLPSPAVGKPEPMPMPVQVAATTEMDLPRMIGPDQPSPQPVPRPPVTVAPLTAIHRVQDQQAQPASADHRAESQRVARAIEQAQRAQAGLLLANLQADSADRQRDTGDRTTDHQIQPFNTHPYLLPRGAPPQQISRAMEQALAKYQTALQQRSGATIAASPRSTPASVR